MLSYRQEVLTDNPVLYFRCEEAAGNLADSSPSGFVGTKNGTITYQVATLLAGLNVGVTPNGTIADFFAVADSPVLDIIADVTYEAWVKIPALGAQMIVMQKGFTAAGSLGGYGFFIDATGHLVVNNTFTGTAYATSTGVIPTGSWVHIAFTRSVNLYSFYINGAFDSSASSATAVQATANSFFIAVGDGGGGKVAPLLGSIDEIAVYNHALTVGRIAAHYAARTNGTDDTTPLRSFGKAIPLPTKIPQQDRLPFFQGDNIPILTGWRQAAAPQATGKNWFVRKGGSDSNGGSSPSLTPERTGNDANGTNGLTAVTIASGAFTQADVGKGIFFVGERNHRILAVIDSTHITIQGALVGNLVNATWNLGGAWATLGNALTSTGATQTVVGGDSLYIGAGIYRETLALLVTPTTELRVVGDVFGTFTGDAGPVTISAWTSGDKVGGGGALVNLGAKSNYTFERLQLVGAVGVAIFCNAGSTNVTFRDCSVIASQTGAMISLTTAYGAPANWTFERCHLLAITSASAPILITLTTGQGADYDANVQFNNCTFPATTASSQFVSVTNSGTLAGKGGGVRFANCFYIGRGPFVSTTAAQVSVLIPCTVYNSIVCSITGAFTAGTQGQIVEDYNIIYCPTPRVLVSTGIHSVAQTYAPLFHFGQERIWGGMPRPYGEPMVGSPWLDFGALDTSTGPLDLRRGPRPSTAPSWDVGPFQRGNNFTKETATVHTGTNAISLIGDGFEDFDLAVDAGVLTVTVYVRYDSSYVGPLPRMQIVNGGQVGVGDVEAATTVLALNAWQPISITINPTASGIVTVRLIAADVSSAGKTIFDSFAVA